MSDMSSSTERLARRTIYESPWVSLHVDRVRLPSGRVIDEHHLVEFERQTVSALVRDDDGRVLLVDAVRYALPTTSWEVPAGRIEAGETAIEAARREILEETGYETADHRELYTYYPVSGISSGTFTLVECRAVARTGASDRDEVSELRWVSREQIAALIASRAIVDGMTLTALLLEPMTGEL